MYNANVPNIYSNVIYLCVNEEMNFNLDYLNVIKMLKVHKAQSMPSYN